MTDSFSTLREKAFKGEKLTIPYDGIISIPATLEKKYPQEIALIRSGLKELENTPHGQQAFKEILIATERRKPISLELTSEISPLAYIPSNDNLAINPILFNGLFIDKHPLLVKEFGYGISSIPSSLFHELDHAIKAPTLGKKMLEAKTSWDRWVAQACYEKSGIEQEMVSRTYKGEISRPDYVDEDEAINGFKEAPKELVATLTPKQMTELSEQVEKAVILDKGCTPGFNKQQAKEHYMNMVTRIEEASGMRLPTPEKFIWENSVPDTKQPPALQPSDPVDKQRNVIEKT